MKEDNLLRILFIEDLPSDTELAERELRKGGISFTSMRVETKKGFLRALKDFRPDLIISDYAMPEFDGMQALKLSLKHDADIPFILFTGSMNEETAVACMKAGAMDYIIKEHLRRLPMVIAGALEQKKARLIEKETEKKYRELFESIMDVFYRTDNDGRVLLVSPSVEKLLGYAPDEFIGKKTEELYVRPEEWHQFVSVVREKGVVKGFETALRAKDGSEIWGSTHARFYRDEQGNILGVQGITHDITERKQAEEALRQNEERYRTILEDIDEGYFEVDLAGNFTLVNDAECRNLGYSREEAIGMNYRQYIDEAPAKKTYELFQNVYNTGKPIKGVEGQFISKDGNQHFNEVSASLIRDAEGKPIGFRGISKDITERKETEEALRRSEENFRRSQEDSLLGVRIVTEAGETIYANRAMLDIYGYDSIDELGATPVGKRYTPESFAGFQTRREKRKQGENGPYEYEISIIRKDGVVRNLQVFRKGVLWDGKKQYQITYHDITERKQVEKEVVKTLHQLQETRDMLIQCEKHAAIGRLAAGIAHETLNPASIISSRLQFLEEENLSEPARENVKVSREQLQRIVKTSHDLLQSSVKKPKVLVGGELHHVIEMGLQMTERRLKEDHVRVEYDPPPAVIHVKMESDRVVKVMVNLILNACDAMTDNQSKRLIVAVHRPEDSSKEHPVVLTVADNGQGIPAINLDRVFEPFFTTKPPGKSTGLGLSVSKGIIEEHGGTIRAEINEMGGASFIVELPLSHS